jgi:hypothetical protein
MKLLQNEKKLFTESSASATIELGDEFEPLSSRVYNLLHFFRISPIFQRSKETCKYT